MPVIRAVAPSNEELVARAAPVFNNLSPQRLLSMAQTADHIGMSASWLRKSRVYGTGPRATVLGRRVLYDLRDVEAWLRTRKQTSTSTEIGAET